jgi:transcriptional regulator with XRE-family HTH domain
MTGKELRRLRDRAGLTQAELASRIGVAPNTIARWERNERKLSVPLAKLIHLELEG